MTINKFLLLPKGKNDFTVQKRRNNKTKKRKIRKYYCAFKFLFKNNYI